MITFGVSPPSMIAFIAAETAGPDNLPAKSPVAYTFVAPCSPRAPAIAVASPPTNAVTDAPIERAFASNSSVPVVGTSPLACANTQMLLIVMMLSSDHFQVLKKCDDLFKCCAVIFDDFTGLTCFGLCNRNNFLSSSCPTSWGNTKVRCGKSFYWL